MVGERGGCVTCTAASTRLALNEELPLIKKGANVRRRDSRTFGFLCAKPPLHFSKRSAGATMREVMMALSTVLSCAAAAAAATAALVAVEVEKEWEAEAGPTAKCA